MTAKLDAKHFFVVLLLIALAMLAACGGGGDDDELDPSLPTPSITGLSVSVANIGETVEIYGLNFGQNQGSGAASCNGTDFTITNWTETRITATVPTGMTSGIVTVRQNNRFSTSGSEAQLFIGTMPGGDPLISAINPNYGNTGDEVLIIGRNFGTSATGGTVFFLPNTMTSQATPVPAEVVTVDVGGTAVPQWTSTSIKVRVPGDTLSAGESSLYVTVGTTQSNTRPFTKLPDQIIGDTSVDAVDPATGPAGTVVTITGNGFGFSQGSSTLTIGGLPLIVVSWDNTEIQATIPSGAGSGAIRLVVNGTPYDSQPFTVGNTPVILGVSPSAVRVGESLTIHGNYFGATPGTGSLRVGSTTVAVDETNWNNAQVYVPKLPRLTISDPTKVPIVVTADNGNSSEPFMVSMTSNLTVVSTVSPSAGEAGTTEFNFNIVASGGSGDYDYELIPDSENLNNVQGPYSDPSVKYTYPSPAGFTTRTFHTRIRVSDNVSGDNTTVAGPDVMVVQQGAPVITSAAVQDFARGDVKAPNDWVVHPFSGSYYDFSFNGGAMYFTSNLSSVTIGTTTFPPFTRSLDEFMNTGVEPFGATPRPYGYRYGSPAAVATGSQVRVVGLNFGDIKGQMWLNSNLNKDGQPTGGVLVPGDDVLTWTDEALVFAMPGGINQDLSGFIVIQTSEGEYAKSATPLIASAYVTSVVPDSWSVGGAATIQIAGFDFSPPQMPGVTGSGVYLFWVVTAQYEDPFNGGNLTTGQALRVTPVLPTKVEGTTIFFPSTELTGNVLIEVMNPDRDQAQVVNGTLVDGDYFFWIWTGAFTTGSATQTAYSGIFSQLHSFTRGGGGGDTWSISGRVTDGMLPPPDNGAEGVTVNLTGAATKSVTTGADGSYTFGDLADGNYTVTPQPNATFDSYTPGSTPVTVNGGNETGINFEGNSLPGPGPGPVPGP